MKPNRCLAILVVVLFLWVSSGCTIVPGSRLLTFNKEIDGEVDRNFYEQVEIHRITFKLIHDLSAPVIKPRTNPGLDREISNYEYKIGKGDILNITVFEHEELTTPAGSYRSAAESGTWVHSDGTIYFPYVGKLRVVGLSLSQIRSRLSSKLSRYIEEAKVEVNVAQFNSQKIYITGEVNDPRRISLTNLPLTLVDAINLAGGLTDNADWRSVTLSREGINEVISVNAILQQGVLTENRLLKVNDIIHVPRNDNLKVFVLGEVKNPSTLTMGRTGMRLTQALSGVGGINEDTADATGVFVIRHAKDSDESKVNIYQLNLTDASAMVLGAEFELSPFDVVYVTAAPIELWNRLVNKLLPSFEAYDLLNTNFSISPR